MIKLDKILLVNWMYYGTAELSFDMSNLLTGSTGSGKSAIIDALQIIFLGEAGGGFFNKSAAGKHTDRTVNTYLRGQYGAGNFTRDKHFFSSHIVCEFYDTVINEHFCYGIMFDMPIGETRPNQDFYYVRDIIRKDRYIDGKTARTRKDLKSIINDSGCEYKIFQTNSEYKQDFIYRLGIYDKQFFKLFRNAVAYEPLDRIEDFIIKNICGSMREIDMESMETAIHEYRNMQEALRKFRSQRDDINKIHEIYDGYNSKHKLRREQQYYIDRASVDAVGEKIAELKENDENIMREYAEKSELHETKQAEYDSTDERLRELDLEIKNSPEAKHKEELKREISTLEARINDIREKESKYRLNVQQRAAAWRRCITDDIPGDNNETKLFLDDVRLYDKDNFVHFDAERLRSQNELLENLQQNIYFLNRKNEEKLNENKENIRELENRIEQLKKGRKHYDLKLLEFRKLLQDKLSAEAGKSVSVDILADLIEITDKRWINVIEGYMNRQKFYLLVEPEYYERAQEICRDYYNAHPNEEYKLIDGEKVYEAEKNIRPMSLSGVIRSDNIYARAYIDYLVGGVVRVDNLRELRNHKTAVTDDGMLYSGYTFGRIKKDLWRVHYIGRESVTQQLEDAQKILADLKSEKETLEKNARIYAPVISEKLFSDEFISGLSDALEGVKQLPKLNAECDKLFEEMTSIDNSYTERLEKEKRELRGKIENLKKHLQELDRKLGALNEQHTQNINSIEEYENEFEVKNKRFNDEYNLNIIPESFKDNYNKILNQKRKAQAVIDSYVPALERTKSDIQTYKDNFINAVAAFNLKYQDVAMSNDIRSGEWLEIYNKIQSTDIGNYESKVNEARMRSEDMFRNEFINKLKANIDEARREIRYLNRALSEYSFGKTKYKFKCEATDNPEMRRYYDMITEKELDGYDLFTKDIYDKYEPEIKTLFDLISSAGDENATRAEVQQNIDKYKSFQSYLKFDLVEVNENGDESPLSRVMGSRSGGERQTPFYIAMLASFMKVYKMNNNKTNSLRLVVFDEAFDKIDSSRIEEFVNMLIKTGFQFIISAPNEKAPYIMKMVESTWAVTKPTENKSQVSLFRQSVE